ncbi:MAG: hypothetical protein FT726_23470 [Pantoea sp. Morm]|uniref:hypothetical protein n=1 Tax=Pantoea sp. Morm TaxID=2601250 RepID=UPI001E12B064|nr:hypothetical protein [Pantoea sp. Morm]
MTMESCGKLLKFIKPYQNKGHSALWIKHNPVPSFYSGRLHPDAPHDFHPVLVTPSGRPLAILDLSDNKWKASGITPNVCNNDSKKNEHKLLHSPEGIPVKAMEVAAFIAAFEKAILGVSVPQPEAEEMSDKHTPHPRRPFYKK